MRVRIIFILCFITNFLMLGQKRVADNFFNKYSYVKASELYEEAFNKGDSSRYILERLGDCYYNNSDVENAAKWLRMAIEKYPNKIDKSYILKYVQIQQGLGNYTESDKWLDVLNESNRKNSQKIEELVSLDERFVEIKNLEVNSKYADFGIFVQDDTILFASSRNTSNDGTSKIYGWNEEPYLDLYEGQISNNNEISQVTLISGPKINTKFHESSAVITNDGSTLYFTRVNVNKRNKLNFDDEGTTHLKLYRATLINDVWDDIVELPFNSDDYSTGHPALSPDNKKLYFISDREGGFGQTDIYYVTNDNNTSYGTPINLGDKVNTKGREMFPFVSKDNTLYFSSDNHINIGLLDIFKSDILNDEKATAQNVGAPYNSRSDDFAFFIKENAESGYFSSNRDGGKGSDDIYSFEVSQCSQNVKGTLRDKNTNEVIVQGTVKLIDESGKIIKEIETNTQGEFIFKEVPCNSSFVVLGSIEDYKDDLKEIQTSGIKNEDVDVALFLTPLINDCEIVLNPIFFDFDKWNIRTDSKVELENIVDVMRQHPEMMLKIESHTDKRGGDTYNLKLSDRRAKSTRDYLISRGIVSNRFISALGYGESRPVNNCSEQGINCSEEEHQENRRSHFIIDGCE